MAHDPLLEQRIADALKAQGEKAEAKKMFGGLAFMLNGNMSVGLTNKNDLMVRFDGARHEEIMAWPGAKPMTHGKPGMKGFLFVDASAVESPKALEKWVKLSLEYVRALPKKAAPKAKAVSAAASTQRVGERATPKKAAAKKSAKKK